MEPDSAVLARVTLDEAVAKIKRELATKDARIAELESQIAKLKPKPFEWKGAGLYRIQCGGVLGINECGAHFYHRHQCWFSFCKETGRYQDLVESPLDLIEFIAPIGGQS